MKSHVRCKLMMLHLRPEDALNDPLGFAAKMEAAALSQLELRIYGICGMHIYSVYPKTRHPTSSAVKIKSTDGRTHHAQAALAKGKISHQQFPIKRRRHNDPTTGRSSHHRHHHHHRHRGQPSSTAVQAKIAQTTTDAHPAVLSDTAANQTQPSTSSASPPPPGAPAALPDLVAQQLSPPAVSTGHHATVANTQSDAIVKENMAFRRTRRENAGKRGGVPSKYKFGDQRIFVGSRLPSSSSLLRRKPVVSRRPALVEDIKPPADDKSLLVDTNKW